MASERQAAMIRLIKLIPHQPQRQDSLEDQLRTVHRFALQLGCYDAADAIKRHFLDAR